MPSYYERNKETILQKLQTSRIPTDNLGRIYRIFTDQVSYIGSTKNVPSLRFRLHINAYNRYVRGTGPNNPEGRPRSGYCASFKVFDSAEGDLSKVHFEVLEKCLVSNLHAREAFHMNRFRGIVSLANKNEANRKVLLDRKAYNRDYISRKRYADERLEWRRLSHITL